jgi:hypothetical protein
MDVSKLVDQLPGAPAAVVAALDRLKDELTLAAGQNLAGLILYGGLARGRYRPGKSDVNVIVLLHDASACDVRPADPRRRSASFESCRRPGPAPGSRARGGVPVESAAAGGRRPTAVAWRALAEHQNLVRVAWYLLAVILGTIGALAVLRAGERLAFGAGSGSIWVPLIVGPVCLLLAWKSLQKARVG